MVFGSPVQTVKHSFETKKTPAKRQAPTDDSGSDIDESVDPITMRKKTAKEAKPETKKKAPRKPSPPPSENEDEEKDSNAEEDDKPPTPPPPKKKARAPPKKKMPAVIKEEPNDEDEDEQDKPEDEPEKKGKERATGPKRTSELLTEEIELPDRKTENRLIPMSLLHSTLKRVLHEMKPTINDIVKRPDRPDLDVAKILGQVRFAPAALHYLRDMSESLLLQVLRLNGDNNDPNKFLDVFADLALDTFFQHNNQCEISRFFGNLSYYISDDELFSSIGYLLPSDDFSVLMTVRERQAFARLAVLYLCQQTFGKAPSTWRHNEEMKGWVEKNHTEGAPETLLPRMTDLIRMQLFGSVYRIDLIGQFFLQTVIRHIVRMFVSQIDFDLKRLNDQEMLDYKRRMGQARRDIQKAWEAEHPDAPEPTEPEGAKKKSSFKKRADMPKFVCKNAKDQVQSGLEFVVEREATPKQQIVNDYINLVRACVNAVDWDDIDNPECDRGWLSWGLWHARKRMSDEIRRGRHCAGRRALYCKVGVEYFVHVEHAAELCRVMFADGRKVGQQGCRLQVLHQQAHLEFASQLRMYLGVVARDEARDALGIGQRVEELVDRAHAVAGEDDHVGRDPVVPRRLSKSRIHDDLAHIGSDKAPHDKVVGEKLG
jgi:hypothetical protein